MKDKDTILREEIRLTILDYLAGIGKIDVIFVLGQIGNKRKETLKDSDLVEIISEINTIGEQVGDNKIDAVLEDTIKERFNMMIDKLIGN